MRTGLQSPLLYSPRASDSRVVLSEARELIARSAPSKDKRLFVYPGSYHAGGLLFEAPTAPSRSRRCSPS